MKKVEQRENETALKILVEKHGATALLYSWLIENGQQNLYNRFLNKGGSLENFAKSLNLHEEYLEQKKLSNGRRVKKWTDETLKTAIKKVVKEYGFLPPKGFLNAENGLQGLGSAIQKFGGHKAIKEKYKIGERLGLYDKSGQIWASFPEASLANYMLSKGVRPMKGHRYPDAYAKMSGMNYGVFDMHFVATTGHLQNKMLNIEIFGDNPGGRGADEYAKVRSFKEKFNENDECFISVEHLECYKIKRLEDIFGKHIAPADSLIKYDAAVTDIFDATMLSLADEVLVRLKRVCEKMPDGLLPSIGWFLRIDRHKNRQIETWEDHTWSGLIDNVSDCGGIMKFRKALGQGETRFKQYNLTKKETIQELKEFHNKWKQTPKAFKHRNKKNLSEDEKLGWEKALELTSCMTRHFASIQDACNAAGISMQRYRMFETKEAVIEGLQTFYEKYHGRSPRSIEKEMAKIKDRTAEQNKIKNDAYNLQGNARKHFESFAAAWQQTVHNNTH